jgi:hypothetical protein
MKSRWTSPGRWLSNSKTAWSSHQCLDFYHHQGQIKRGGLVNAREILAFPGKTLFVAAANLKALFTKRVGTRLVESMPGKGMTN